MKKFYLSVLLTFISTYAIGQQLVPPIQNHTSVEYNGASQNWAIDVDDRGIIYAANNQGLLSFDGQRWELFPLNNSAVIRSVLSHEDRIYTGSYQEFGYWKRNSKGEMQYTSLMPLLHEPMESEEFWEIIPYQNGIYFRSFGAIYEYKNDKIRVVKNIGVNKMAVYSDRLLIAIPKQGLYYLNEDGSTEPLKNQEVLQEKRVLDIEVDGSKLFIGTKDNLFLFNGTRCLSYGSPLLNKQLEEYEFNHIRRSGKSGLLLATVRNGVLHHDMETGNTKVYNRENGLQNNTVLGMTSREGRLWLALDDGIDEIDLQSPISFFTDHTGELGAVYDLEFFQGEIYAASNTGIYRIDSKLSMIPGGQGHTWNLELLDGRLYANHNSGTFEVQDNEVVPLDNRTGSFQIKKSPYEDMYYIGTYTGISVYNPFEKDLQILPDIRFPVKKLFFETAFILWAEHANKGTYRMGLSSDYSEINFLQQIGGDEIDYRSNLFKVNGQISFLKDGTWYKYNTIKDTLEVFEELIGFNNHELLLEDENGYWFSNRSNSSVVFTNFKDQEVKISFEELNKRPVKANEAMIKAGDSLYYLTLKDGFARIDLQGVIKHRETQSLKKPFFKAFLDENSRHELSSSPIIPYNNSRNLTILVGYPGSTTTQLYYELKGDRNLGGKVEKGSLTFQNLSHGDYRLSLFAMDPQGKTSESTSMEFTIGAPWYLLMPMKVVYVSGLLLIFAVIYLLNKRKLRKHRLFLEEKLEKEHKERIERLEKKRLEDEIMMKRKELANTTLMAAKKNEVLMDIQGELNKDRDKFSNQYRLKHIMSKINKAIKNKDEWQVFETNFREVHEDFSKDLLESYPKLTSKDLKLCSYLKMNLTSKEIAPLMGKSVRGVEVHRYRLRKKMNLDSQENLSSFLIKNF